MSSIGDCGLPIVTTPPAASVPKIDHTNAGVSGSTMYTRCSGFSPALISDRAVQLLGGRGVMAGNVVELLYRAIRPLRIYEGTSEIQRTIIGRAPTKDRGGAS